MAAETRNDGITLLNGSLGEPLRSHHAGEAGNGLEERANPVESVAKHVYGPQLVEAVPSTQGEAPSIQDEASEPGEKKEEDLDLETADEGGVDLKPTYPTIEDGQDLKSFKPRKKRDSEWVFKPLKLKFRVKELEELYKKYVFRQRQYLLFVVCLVIMALALLEIVMYLGTRKVRLTYVVVCAFVLFGEELVWFFSDNTHVFFFFFFFWLVQRVCLQHKILMGGMDHVQKTLTAV